MFCNSCERLFDEPIDTSYVDTHYSHGTRYSSHGGLECPYCGDSDIEDSVSCYICGEDSRSGICKYCLKEQANYDNALLISIETNDTTIITSSNASEYCLEDSDWFIEWLKDRAERGLIWHID